MAAVIGLAMLGQVICLTPDVCAEVPAETSDEAAIVTEIPVVADPTPACDWPVCGPLGARLYCIEGFESRHFGGAVNPRSGTRGWLQWLPSTARQWGVVIGDRQSEWSAAVRIASQGERFFRSQWPVTATWCP